MTITGVFKTQALSRLPKRKPQVKPTALASGTLDPGFGSGGKVIAPLTSSDDAAFSAVLQNDGKILVGGSAANTNNSDFALVRYTQNGRLDTSFGTGGRVTTDVDNTEDYGYSLVLQPDGKIVLVGSASTGNQDNFALVRYNRNGTLDTSFGMGGKVRSDFSVYDNAYSAVLQADGKIVVAGSITNASGNDDFAVVRYNRNGNIDKTFNGNGIATTDLGANEYGYSLIQQVDGKFVVLGETDNVSGSDFALVRYNRNGRLDQSFGVGGKVTTNFSRYDYASSMALQQDGKLLAIGYSSFSASNYTDFAIARYNPNGSLDQTFGTGGKVSTPLGSSFDAKASIAVQKNGKIVVVGTINGSCVILRYNPDGKLDSSFGTGGKAIPSFGNTAEGQDVALQQDGKIIAVGNVTSGNTQDFAIARYLGNQAPTNIHLSHRFIPELSPKGTVVGVLSTIDSDIEPHTYTLLNDAKGRFALKGNQVVVANRKLLNYEDDKKHTIRIRARDSYGAFVDKTIVVHITNVKEPVGSSCATRFATPLSSINFRQRQRGVHLQGTSGADTLRGTHKSDVVKGLGGDDRIIAGSGKSLFGSDRLYGGRGNDTIWGGRGNDSIEGGKGNDKLSGGGERDRIQGEAGNDRLQGNKGNDILIGGSGKDTLTGGTGRDTFAFHSIQDGVDLITDFWNKELIDLRDIFDRFKINHSVSCDRLEQLINVVQVGKNTEIRIDADGLASGRIFRTLAVLQDVSAQRITSSNFLVG